MGQFKIECEDWIKYRKLPDLTEVDFHLNQEEPPHHDYDESMGDTWQIALGCTAYSPKFRELPFAKQAVVLSR